jgi:hypothetical protein
VTAAVRRAESDAEASELEVKVTVARLWSGQRPAEPKASDVPPDIRAALLDWLGTAEEAQPVISADVPEIPQPGPGNIIRADGPPTEDAYQAAVRALEIQRARADAASAERLRARADHAGLELMLARLRTWLNRQHDGHVGDPVRRHTYRQVMVWLNTYPERASGIEYRFEDEPGFQGEQS